MAAENIVTLTDSNFNDEVINSDKPVLVDFWAEWCGPCKMIAPVLEELAGELDGKVKIGKVNIDDYQSLANQHGIRAIPTMLLFKNGEVQEQIVGMRGKQEIKSKLESAMG